MVGVTQEPRRTPALTFLTNVRGCGWGRSMALMGCRTPAMVTASPIRPWVTPKCVLLSLATIASAMPKAANVKAKPRHWMARCSRNQVGGP